MEMRLGHRLVSMPEVTSEVYDMAGLRLPDRDGLEEGEGEPTPADSEM